MDEPSWYRQRRYLHFDEPLGLDKASTLVLDPAKVSRHSFWPLINYTVKTEKLRREPLSGNLEKISKDRPISYAAHSDSHILSYYCQLLSERYEAKLVAHGLSDSVLAFRSLGQNNIHFANSAFQDIKTCGDCEVVALDVSKFFDTIDHQLLKKFWKSILDVDELPADHYAVYRAITKYASVNRDALFFKLGISSHNPRSVGRRICTPDKFRTAVRDGGLVKANSLSMGVPQGTAISALLSNIYMLDFDRQASQFVATIGGRYMRYCDDILFIVPPDLADTAKKFAESGMASLKLSINAAKTDISKFNRIPGDTALQCNRPLQYLGFLFDGKKVLIRSAAFAKFSNRMKRGVRLAKATASSRNKLREELSAAGKAVYKKKLLSRYSHLGRRNFLRYGYRAADILDSPAIKRQLRPLWSRLLDEIEKD